MKRVALLFALFFVVALIFPANAPAPLVVCGNGILDPGEECDGDAGACPGECMEDCTCPDPPICGDDMVNQPSEECDGTDDEACPGECMEDCTCPEPGICDPRTQGFWKRVCAGVYGVKRMHPETPENFDDPELCDDLMARGERFLPCVRSASQIAALKLNSKYGILDGTCKVYYEDMEMTVGEVLADIDELNDKDCKAAADLAEAINSRDAL